MEVNLKILGEELKRFDPEVIQEREGIDHKLKGAELWKKNSVFSPDICYVAKNQEITEKYICPENITLIIVGDIDKEKVIHFPADMMILHVTSRKEMFYDVFNFILKVFRKYQEFEEKIQRLLIKNSVGLIGIILLIGQIAGPLVLLVAFSLLLKLAGAVMQAAGDKGLYSLFSDLSSDAEYFVAGLLTVSFMYALTIMLVINSAGTFI